MKGRVHIVYLNVDVLCIACQTNVDLWHRATIISEQFSVNYKYEKGIPLLDIHTRKE